MRKKCFLKSVFVSILLTVAVMLPVLPVYAAGGVPYEAYTFDYWGFVIPSPASYVPTVSIGAQDIDPSIGRFKDPQDIFVDKNENIYLLDTGNNRIVIFDKDLNLKKIIDSFINEEGETDTFNEPFGLFVSPKLEIYIADTLNYRVVGLDQDGNLLRIIKEPQYETLEDNFVFAPISVVVDAGGRVYTVVRHVYEGIMSFDTDGTFYGYFGTINVRYNPLDLFWRSIATDVQRSRMRLFIPVEFASMDIDPMGFIYTTNVDPGTAAKIKRLNPRGQDVITNFTRHRLTGDLRFRPAGRASGPSQFIDIKARPNGMYSVLDSTRGRVYTYDSEGNMLYIFGGSGNVLGTGRYPAAIEVLGDNILILDRQRGEIVYFEETEYGRLINEAVGLRYSGDETQAVEKWRDVIELNGNYTLAYTGIGKALLAAGDNKQAMEYLRKGMSVEYYSIAFKRFRNDFLKENLSLVLTLIFALIFAYVVFRIYRSRKRRKAHLILEMEQNRALHEKIRQERIKRGDAE